MWQWYYEGNWVECTPENQAKLDERAARPSVVPMTLSNPFGALTGRLEDGHMHFCVVGEEEGVRTFVRKGPAKNESRIYACIERGLRRVIPYETGRKLFRNGKPSLVRREATSGTEHYVALGGRLFKQVDGELHVVHWEQTDLSRFQYLNMTKSRLQWEFKGAFRWQRMRAAVSHVARELDDSSALDEAFETFDPELDATEHGPFQFGDYLVSRGLHELAVRVMDAYHAASPTDSEWSSFDAVTNEMIEKARGEGRPMAPIMVRGHQYVVIFDSGSGASGQPPVVIRPLRYERILTSIEENFERGQMRRLYDAIVEAGCNPRLFLLAAMTDENAVSRLIPAAAQERIRALLNDDNTASMGTVLQTQLPTLLEKYKECDVRLSVTEKLSPKPLESAVKQTLVTGLRVPHHLREHCETFEQLIAHIHKNQAWQVGKGQHVCDICSAKTAVLGGHCGTAKACLKCWADSLQSTRMQCPFCRQEVDDAQLTLVTAPPPPKTRARNKRKRRLEFNSAEEALAKIHQDQLYAHFKLEDNQSMRKWFTVLMRSGMLKNGQLPRNMQAKKSLRTALHEFNVLN